MTRSGKQPPRQPATKLPHLRKKLAQGKLPTQPPKRNLGGKRP